MTPDGCYYSVFDGLSHLEKGQKYSAGFEPEFEPRLAHYSKCYTYTWFLLGFAKHIHIQFGA